MEQKTRELSQNRRRELGKLQQKKWRLSEGKVVVEGLRSLRQLRDWGIEPLEQYLTEGSSPLWASVPAFQLRDWELGKICGSDHPQGSAALFELPRERPVQFRQAFYLDGISDPGNLGTIFRIAASFDMGAILLSADCVEVSSPKVIRASLGSVFRVPFQILGAVQLQDLKAELILTEAASGEPLRSYSPEEGRPTVIVLGSEARGISNEIKALAAKTLRIEMGEGMESLNVAVAAGIIAHHLYRR
ncbi:MAG: RNA methyltransferase [Candidatus Cloacimonetes bacterium]|nr:RNA methyltransferase [Candidatus Cloacimonadota bacterium]